MKLRAEIGIELDADDFVAAADHQRRVELLHEQVRNVYPEATLVLRERKQRDRPRTILPEAKVAYLAGRSNPYID